MEIRKAVFAAFVPIIVAAVLVGGTLCVIHAQSSKPSDSAVLAKLDAVLSAQASIKEELTAIKEDLRIIKIRITQSQ
jgi:uncharacterized PurR-regulated membrane protein YhhQ (DUF165 family)